MYVMYAPDFVYLISAINYLALLEAEILRSYVKHNQIFDLNISIYAISMHSCRVKNSPDTLTLLSLI